MHLNLFFIMWDSRSHQQLERLTQACKDHKKALMTTLKSSLFMRIKTTQDCLAYETGESFFSFITSKAASLYYVTDLLRMVRHHFVRMSCAICGSLIPSVPHGDRPAREMFHLGVFFL